MVESPIRRPVDTGWSSRYLRFIEQMTAKRIQIGQVWKKVGTDETFLVTKLYNEALATIAVLRPTAGATESMIRVRVDRRGDDQALPGYSMAQEHESVQ
jgi:hypothetical protein